MKKHIAPFVADEWFPETKLDTTNKSGNLPNMKLNTINVLESPSGFPNQLTAYPYTKEGIEAAEQHFLKVVESLNNVWGEPLTNDEVDEILDNGYFSNEQDEVFLIHST